MSQPGYPPADGAGERWSVNMPAVIGVVFVFLVAVVVWVIATGGDTDDDAVAPTVPSPTAAPAALVTTTVAGAPATTTTTTPGPLPATTLATTIVSTTPATTTEPPAATTVAPTTAAPTTVPPTAAPTTIPPDDGGTVGGDLGIAGTPMRRPACDDAFITIIASAIGAEATADSIASVLGGFPGSNYLRTDQTCPSLNPSVGGEPIYVVYFGPFEGEADACAARSRGTSGSYVRVLSNALGPDHSVSCA